MLLLKLQQLRDHLESLEKAGAHPNGLSRSMLNQCIKYAQQDVEPVAWQYRWLNPLNENHPESALRWEPCEPKYAGQTLEARIAELRSYEMDGKPQYEVRPLYEVPNSEFASKMKLLQEEVDRDRKRSNERNERWYKMRRDLPNREAYVAQRLRELADHLDTGRYPLVMIADVPAPDEPLLPKGELTYGFHVSLSHPWPG